MNSYEDIIFLTLSLIVKQAGCCTFACVFPFVLLHYPLSPFSYYERLWEYYVFVLWDYGRLCFRTWETIPCIISLQKSECKFGLIEGNDA